MSDGALSQDEIDALLAGVDSSGLGGAPPPPPPGPPSGDSKILQDFLAATVGTQSSNLSMMTGTNVVFKGPRVSSATRDAFLQSLPDMVTLTKADFSSGFPGEHLFLMGEDTAKSIASLMNKEENIELDEMALSVIGEVVSTLLGSQITALTDKTGNKSIASISPEATNVPKAVAALPGGTFTEATYDVDLGDGKSHPIWEVFGSAVSADITRALSGGGSPAPNMGGLGGMAGLGGGGSGMGAMGGNGMSGMGMGGMGFGQPTNVQSIQFPNLMPQASPQEQGNIGLIMDVYMEMTVELGRTRKLIKEILGMGEGTIIELDKLAGEPVDILVNHKLIAKGEVVVIDENFGVRVTEIVSPIDRVND
ncbi:MAG: flagellar motor switch protein FliN [Spirochaetaceae bacterium]|jgi:flagellar motor switch protein FliN/FliY|nr:flagellar motor switch protein FliN [Spirochaetaceae bacterium]